MFEIDSFKELKASSSEKFSFVFLFFSRVARKELPSLTIIREIKLHIVNLIITSKKKNSELLILFLKIMFLQFLKFYLMDLL